MQFIDLQTQYRRIETQIQKRINQVFNHCQFIMGPEIKELETQLAHYVQAKHCIAVASGTDALTIAMLALNIRPGDEVITSPFSFIASAETIALLGAKPVFVDIDKKTYNINPECIANAITKKTKLILAVDIFGQCADYDSINAIAKEHDLAVIEDGAQSFGATYKQRPACNLATIACTSFFPSKPLGCYGDGGACFTNDDNLAQKMQQIREHGQDQRYHHICLGINGRLDTLQAAILLEKLAIFDDELKQRQKLAKLYTELLKNHAITPYISSENTSSFAQYTIQIDNRSQIQETLKSMGIPTAIHYPICLPKQPALAHYDKETLPEAETLVNKVLSLPFHPYLTEETIWQITSTLIKAIKKQQGIANYDYEHESL